MPGMLLSYEQYHCQIVVTYLGKILPISLERVSCLGADGKKLAVGVVNTHYCDPFRVMILSGYHQT
jgi:hypothetical protein